MCFQLNYPQYPDYYPPSPFWSLDTHSEKHPPDNLNLRLKDKRQEISDVGRKDMAATEDCAVKPSVMC